MYRVLTINKIIKGYATVTLTLIIPVFLLFIFGLYEIVQMLHTQSVIVNLSRESAHLISRTSDYTEQNIMDVVATTSQFVDMNSDGIIYISHVVGQTGDNPYITEQFKWTQAGIDKASELWPSCASWVSGQCELPSDTAARELTGFPITMEDNDSVYVVEVFYTYRPIFSFVVDEDVTIGQATYL
ncbi:TadE family protein [Vibrio sp. 99-8-1]|uniref:TadE/TadG family type IV pilus assembly protein n=1 Tax=Vibrio sp. 99-8-1 TaxID=2607602 RepID=UPI001493ADB0|nr:TadE family protein [Vibrio sp. 99-8-1]NOI65259.1 pilus assembly protein [Vibrio sp. 99-8-1]